MQCHCGTLELANNRVTLVGSVPTEVSGEKQADQAHVGYANIHARKIDPPAEEESPGTPLAVRHLLGHVQKQTPVWLLDAAKETTEAAQITSIFSGASPRDIVRTLPLGKVWKLGRFFAVIEELVERDFHGSSQLFQRLDRRNGVTVLDTRDVAAKQSRALFDVALGKLFCFT